MFFNILPLVLAENFWGHILILDTFISQKRRRPCGQRRSVPRQIRFFKPLSVFLCQFIAALPHGFLFYRKKGKHPVTVALWRQGCRNLTEHYGWIRRTCAEGRAVLVLDITGMGMLEQRQFLSWTQDEGFYGARFRLNADLVWLGDSLMALGCFDLLRSLDAAEQMPEAGGEEIRLFTAGRYAFYGEIAALLDGRILGLEEENPPETWTQVVRERYYDPTDMAAFVIPGILRYADIPDIRKWREENESNRK